MPFCVTKFKDVTLQSHNWMSLNGVLPELANLWKRYNNAILFLEMYAIAQARAGTHASKFTCAIYHMCKITVF